MSIPFYSLTLLILIVITTAGCTSRRGYQVLRLKITSKIQFQYLQRMHNDSSLDFWSFSDVMVGPSRINSFKEQLRENKISFTVRIYDVQTTIDKERSRQLIQLQRRVTASSISFDKYNRYEDIRSYLQSLSSDSHRNVTWGSIGSTSEGRDIPYVTISPADSAKAQKTPIILIDGGIHAREWISTAMALYTIQQLVENPNNTDLTNEVTWIVIPLLNPDGYEYSHTTDRMWRKSRSKQDECYGVDLNRNFDFHWMESGTSTYECSETYGGPSPFSEPEARALQQIVLKNQMRIKMYISFHSYGNYILYPWGYDAIYPDNNAELSEVATRANNAQLEGGTPYTIGPSAYMLYPAAGCSDDWMKGQMGVNFSYTVELSGGGREGFDLPEDEIRKTVSAFFPAIRVFGEHVANPVNLSNGSKIPMSFSNNVNRILVILTMYSRFVQKDLELFL